MEFCSFVRMNHQAAFLQLRVQIPALHAFEPYYQRILSNVLRIHFLLSNGLIFQDIYGIVSPFIAAARARRFSVNTCGPRLTKVSIAVW